jgi:hypothetical protein
VEHHVLQITTLQLFANDFSHLQLAEDWWVARSKYYFTCGRTIQLIASSSRLLYEAEVRGESVNLVVR